MLMTMSNSVAPAIADPAPWFVYLVRCKDGTLYTGIATDVARRLAEHGGSTGRGAKYLRGRLPLELLLARKLGSRESALRVEYRIKRLPRARKESLVRDLTLLDRIVADASNSAMPS